MTNFEPNNKQRKVLWGAIVLAVLMLVFPPFHFINEEHVQINLGYAFLLDPPILGTVVAGNVNLSLLLAQWLILAVVAGVLYLLMSGQPSAESPPPAQTTLAASSLGQSKPAVQRMTKRTPLKWLIRIVTVAAGLAAIGIIRGIAHDVGGPEAFIARIILVGTIAGGLVWVWTRTSRMR